MQTRNTYILFSTSGYGRNKRLHVEAVGRKKKITNIFNNFDIQDEYYNSDTSIYCKQIKELDSDEKDYYREFLRD
jgi:CRISPR/Cas system-associated protein endoribonuclease Cas2